MKITLTFDNGPDPQVTPHVLEVLKKRGIRAVFFLLGNRLTADGVKLAAQAVADGHLLGNHTFTHSTPLGQRPDSEGVDEVVRTEAALQDLFRGERLFRPHGGGGLGPHLLSQGVWDLLQQRKYTCVLWNCMAYEWETPDGWMQPTLERAREREHSVIVLHDLPSGAMEHLDEFIAMLEAEGATFTQTFPDDCAPLRGGQIMWRDEQVHSILRQPTAAASATDTKH